MDDDELDLLTEHQLYVLVKKYLIRQWLGYGCISVHYEKIFNYCRNRNLSIYSCAVDDSLKTIACLQCKMDGLKITNIKRIDFMNEEELLLFIQTIGAARKHSLVDDSLPKTYKITELLGIKPGSLIICDVSGHSMLGANIEMGDKLFVDTSIEAKSDDIVIARFNGEMFVKRLKIDENGNVWLNSENKRYKPFKIEEHDEIQIMGVVKFVLKVSI